jgi:hypothetical protein
MKKIIFGLMFLSALAMTTAVFAAPGRGMGGWGAGTEYGRMYNTQTVETVTGEVVKVKKIKPMRGMSYGIHLILKTDNGEIPVHLGPAWYINNQDMEVQAGDKVEVKGSRVTYDDKPALIAAEVKKGEDTLKLRNDNGFPAWAGWRRNQ